MKTYAKIIVTIALFLSLSLQSFSQDETKNSTKYLTWAFLQIMPSPVFFQDADENNARIQFGLRWQLIPVNISFRANKYVSPFQFFMINPVRRFTGSVEIFVQPEWASGSFRYANLNRFGIGLGSRVIIPVSGVGQNIFLSLGSKYNYHKTLAGDNDSYYGIETGIYSIFGILGLQFNYNFNSKTRYNVGLYFKYF